MLPWASAPICWHCYKSICTPKYTEATHSRLVTFWFIFHTNNKRISPKRENPLCKHKLPQHTHTHTPSLCLPISLSPLSSPKSRSYWPTCYLLIMPSSLLSVSPFPKLHPSIILQLPEQAPSVPGHIPQRPKLCPWYRALILLEHLKKHLTIIHWLVYLTQ